MGKSKKSRKYESITIFEIILYMTIFVICIFGITVIFVLIQESKTNAQIIEEINYQGKKIIWEISRDVRQGSNIEVYDEEIVIDNDSYYLEDDTIYFIQEGEQEIEFSANRVVVKEFNVEEVSLSEEGNLVQIDVLLGSVFSRSDYEVRFYGKAYSRN